MGLIGGFVGILVNILISVIELIVGAVVNSVAITAHAFNSLSDVASSAITMVSFKIAGKPADKEHPFGHGRIEYLSSLLVAMVIIIIGYEFVKTSVAKIFQPSDVIFNLVSLILVLAAIPLKIFLSRFYKVLGTAIDSSTLKASAFDAFSDVLIMAVASLSIIMSAFTDIQIDGYIGVLVALFIIYSGIKIAKEELDPLLGQAPDPKLVKSIEQGVLNAKYVSGVHDLIIHNYGPGKFMASIHAEVPCDVPVLNIHEAIDEAEKHLSEKLGIILVIHMDPLNNNDEVVRQAKSVVINVIKDIPQALSIHDLRVVGDGEHKNVVFDVVADTSVVSKKDEEKLISEIAEAVKKKNPQYNAVISVDRNYSQFNSSDI